MTMSPKYNTAIFAIFAATTAAVAVNAANAIEGVDNAVEKIVDRTVEESIDSLDATNAVGTANADAVNANASSNRELKRGQWHGDGYHSNRGPPPGHYAGPGYYGPPPGYYGPHGPPGRHGPSMWGPPKWGSGKSGKGSKGSGKSSKSEGWGGWRVNGWNNGWGGWGSGKSSKGSGKSGKGSKGSGKSSKGSGKSGKNYYGGTYYYSHTHNHGHDGWSDDDWNGWWGGHSGKGGKGGYSGKSGKGGYSAKGGKGDWGGYSGKGGKSQYGEWVWVDDDGGNGGWSDDGWSDDWSDDWSNGWNGGSGKSGKGSYGGKSGKGGDDGWSDDGWTDDWSGSSGSGGSGKSGKGGSDDNSDWADDWSGSDGGSSSKNDDNSWGGWDTDGWGTDGWNADGWDNDGHYQADILYVRGEINKMISEDRGLIPEFLRLGFHDCVGGCNGCIDLSNPDNNGLEEPMIKISYIAEKYKNSYSRADIWALGALAAADFAVPAHMRPAGLSFPMRYFGRRDCKDADHVGRGGPKTELPSNDLTTHELLQFFRNEFNFNADETVTIMGAHAISSAVRENSGFGLPDREVGWVFDKDSFILDNRYYAMIVGDYDSGLDHPDLAPEWEVEYLINDRYDGVPNRHQWYHHGPDDERPIMTSSDIALVRDLDGYIVNRDDGTFGQVNCFFNKVSRDAVLSEHPDLVSKNEIVSPINPEANNFGSGGGSRDKSELELRTSGFRRNLMEESGTTILTTQQQTETDVSNSRNLKDIPPMCPMASETIEIALEYKMDNDLWLLEFQDALEKMLVNGYSWK